LAAALQLGATTFARALALPTFGQGWAFLEATSRALQRRRVRFKDLPSEITAAKPWCRIAERLGRTVVQVAS
jgi:hypothetical protein